MVIRCIVHIHINSELKAYWLHVTIIKLKRSGKKVLQVLHSYIHSKYQVSWYVFMSCFVVSPLARAFYIVSCIFLWNLWIECNEIMTFCALYAVVPCILKKFQMKRVDHCLYIVALQDCIANICWNFFLVVAAVFVGATNRDGYLRNMSYMSRNVHWSNLRKKIRSQFLPGAIGNVPGQPE